MKKHRFYLGIVAGLALFISTLFGSGENLNRNIVSDDEVVKLYIATFDRIPDIDGLDYWVNDSGLTIESIAQSFFDQPETQSKYPDTLSTDEFVKAVYNNLFGRDPDSNGLNYWVQELDSGSISKDDFILAVTNGALDNDEYILLKKTDFAINFMNDNSSISSTEYTQKATADFASLNRDLSSSEDSTILSQLNDLLDDIKDNFDEIEDKYQEYTSSEDDRGEKPFTSTFQEDEYDRVSLISSNCSVNEGVKYLSYTTPTDAYSQYWVDIQNLISNPQQGILKPFLDIRYYNPMTEYIYNGDFSFYPNHSEFTGVDARVGTNNIVIGTNASTGDSSGGVAQSKCVDGDLVVGTTINLYDTPDQFIEYGGPQATFVYQLEASSLTSPWSSDQKGNLAIEAYFDEPIYANYMENMGGSISFGLFLNNKKTGEKLNYVIAVYLIGDAWVAEKAGIKFDPTTNIAHIATVIDDSSWWSTKSPKSLPAKEIKSDLTKRTVDDGIWSNLYRVNISYQNLLAVLNELKTNPPVGAENQNFGLYPEDWEVSSIMVQYELEETGGKALLSGSFKGFQAYISQDAI
jgi:hypothetical protein